MGRPGGRRRSVPERRPPLGWSPRRFGAGRRSRAPRSRGWPPARRSPRSGHRHRRDGPGWLCPCPSTTARGSPTRENAGRSRRVGRRSPRHPRTKLGRDARGRLHSVGPRCNYPSTRRRCRADPRCPPASRRPGTPPRARSATSRRRCRRSGTLARSTAGRRGWRARRRRAHHPRESEPPRAARSMPTRPRSGAAPGGRRRRLARLRMGHESQGDGGPARSRDGRGSSTSQSGPGRSSTRPPTAPRWPRSS